ncbi:hypothetical protein Tco_0966059 [Tanacetum coccineum]
MTTPITTSTTDSQIHNNIMAAGLKDRPLMLATGRYAQWQSCFLRYIDTKTNGDALRKCILEGPYMPTTVTIPAIAATDDSPAIPQHTTVETILNMSPENKAHYQSEKEAIFLLLTRIRDEIYSTVDACKTTIEMWIAVERLQQGESLNIQDVKTNLFWEFGKFTSRDRESMESYYSHQECKSISTCCSAQQYPDPYYQVTKPQRSYAPAPKQSSSTRSNASTRYKGKEIAKPITPPYESDSKEDSDLEQAQKDKEMQKNLALIAKYFKKFYKPTNNNLKTSSNSRNKNVDTSPRYKNDNQSRQFGNQRTLTIARAMETECRKPKRVKDYKYHKEKMLLCKQARKGVPLQAEQADWLEDTDEEIDEQELEVHYKKVDSNVIPNSSDMCDNDDQTGQNAVECDDERAALANLIANLTLDT